MDQRQGGVIREVERGGLGEYLGLKPGDRIISVNGNTLRDELDYRFYVSDENVTLRLRTKDGKDREFRVDKNEDDHLGVTFEEPIFDGMKTCKNNCVFCFIRQIPEEMRPSLHVRDDDYRMSFLYGNFISLTNLTKEDWERLEEQRLSPIRISVHSTESSLRQRLMRNPEAGKIMEHLRRLADIGIWMHAQIVLLRGQNDGERLLRTLRDLDSLGPQMVSVGVVPAIYTKYRREWPSERIDAAWARETLDLVEKYAQEAFQRRDDHWVYGADELYYLAERDFPPYDYYGEFHQYDNGIGVVTDWRHSLSELANSPRPVGNGRKRRAIAITGEMAQGEIRRAVCELGLDSEVTVCPVHNVFFGDSVTCSGLLTGQDIVSSVLSLTRAEGGTASYDEVLVPSISLFQGAFLDNMTLKDIEGSTGLMATEVEPSPRGLYRAVRGRGDQ
jgi:putative radical SAM enzyme (TIGR03279 family)